MYLENFTVGTANTDAGWTCINNGNSVDTNLQTYGQSSLSTGEPGINNNQLPSYTTAKGIFRSSGYYFYYRTSEYSFDASTLTSLQIDARKNSTTATHDIYFLATVGGVEYISPVVTVQPGNTWATYSVPASSTWNICVQSGSEWTSGGTVAGLPAGTVTSFGVYFRTAGGGNLYLDNYALTPEPATMSLLGLGVVGLLRRRS
jgi:hypothetical protein